MTSIIASIKPKWCELIVSGKKTIEVRKIAPKEVPFKVYMYCTVSHIISRPPQSWMYCEYRGIEKWLRR